MHIRCTLPYVAVATLLSTLSIAHAETTSDTDWSGGGGDTGDPVTIEILSPQDGDIVAPDVSVVVSTAIVGGGGEVDTVLLRVDGELQEESCAGAGMCTFELELEPGEHAFVAIAQSIDAEWTDEITVTVEPAPTGTTTGAETGGSAGDTADVPGGSDDAADTGEAGTDGAPADDADSEKGGCACSAGEDGGLAPLALGLFALIPTIRRRVRG